MEKNLYCILGYSGSGKTSLCQAVEQAGHKQIPSYTTRKPRTPDETGHIFVSDKEFEQLENIVAYADYRGAKYGVTAQQIDNTDYDLYVVDYTGLKYLRQNYKGNRKIVSIYLHADIPTVFERLSERYSEMPVVSRTELVLKRLSDDIVEFHSAKSDCDYTIFNGSLPLHYAVEKLKKIIAYEESQT